MKQYKKTLILTSIICLVPIFVGVLLWNQLPDTIATHFGANNEPNGWSSKPFTVFGLPLFLLVMQWICVAATLNDPKKKNISDKLFRLILWIVPVVSMIVMGATYGYALGMELNIGLAVNLMIGIMFIIMGNYLPKCKQNYTMGIKIPWTLHSEENWNKTHRLSGWLMMMGGILFLINAFWLNVFVMIAAIVLMVLVPMVYSFVLYKKGI